MNTLPERFANSIPIQHSRSALVELGKEINELEALIASGELSPDEESRARVILADARAAHHAINPGRLPDQEALDDALDAMTRVDVFIGDERVAADGADAAEDDLGFTGISKNGLPDIHYATTPNLKDILSDGAALRDTFESDPEAFAAGWRELDAEDRQLALFSLQQEVALDNQVTQMITGTLKSAHDTAMAVARNLQV